MLESCGLNPRTLILLPESACRLSHDPYLTLPYCRKQYQMSNVGHPRDLIGVTVMPSCEVMSKLSNSLIR